MIAKKTSLIGAALAIALLTAACGGMHTYPLPVSAANAHRTFAPISACAGRQGYQVALHADSINVRVDPLVWVQFMIQGPAYNMVVVVSGDVPEHERAARAAAAKAKGDALFACAQKAGAGGTSPGPL